MPHVLLSICMFSLEKRLFKFFAQVLISPFINVLQQLIHYNSLRSILNIFLIIYIFSDTFIILWAVFSLSCWLSKHKSIKFLCSLIYLFISFFVCVFGVISKKLLPKPRTCRFTPVFLRIFSFYFYDGFWINFCV